MATVNAVLGVGSLQLGTQLVINGQGWPGGFSFFVAAVFGVLVGRAFFRVSKLDKFEKEIKRG